MGLSALAHITDLFVEGKELVVRQPVEGGPPPVLVWVNKLNTFEKDEARRAAAVARARTILAIKELGSPERTLYEANVSELDDDGFREALSSAKALEWRAKAMNAVRADPEWTERYQVAVAPAAELGSEEDVAIVVKTQQALLDEMEAREKHFQAEYERSLRALTKAQLREKHMDAWLDNQGLGSFGTELRRQQIYFCFRVCRATEMADGKWDHAGCDHSKRVCDDIAEVNRIPDELSEALLTTLNEIVVPDDDARFSAEAEISSGPSQSSEMAEGSAHSGPEVTSDEQDKTS